MDHPPERGEPGSNNLVDVKQDSRKWRDVRTSAAASAGGGASKPRRNRPSHSYVAAQQANAAKREWEEWDRTRGAGSQVVIWYHNLLKKQRLNNSEEKKDAWTATDVMPPIEKILQRTKSPMEVTGMDRLLDWGLCDYTILPKTLGRGRFSTVYLATKHGERYAVKHTPLFPHHELVATRLLREPSLLAEIPPHPNLVSVVETIRTPGHFYLVEEYLDGYVTLEALMNKHENSGENGARVLPYTDAERVLEQLVMALHAIHTPVRVCHRDVKPENVLVHPETLQLKLLDFGLATHYSRSHPRLTTCCGSPAFHCPEIVTALSRPLGSVAYWGPEVDAWTCGLTILRCLTGIRYPLGTSHPSPAAMGARAKRVLAGIEPSQLRDDVASLLDLDAVQRMRNFDALAERVNAKCGAGIVRERRELKCTSFLPAPPQHTMVLPLVLTNAAQSLPSPDLRLPIDTTMYSMITLLNTAQQPIRRVLSFIKYCFRCAGILYNTIGISSKHDEAGVMRVPTAPVSDGVRACAFQCVVELIEDEEPGALSQMMQSLFSLFSARTSTEELIKLPTRALDPKAHERNGHEPPPSSGPSGKQGPLRMLVFNVVVAFPMFGSDTPIMPHEFEEPTPEMIAAALQRRFVPMKRETSTPRRTGRSRSVAREEPNLRIETHAEQLPPPQIVPSPSPAHSRSCPQSRQRSLSCRSSHCVHVYVSDSRALPYVRGALSNGGVLKSDAFWDASASDVSRHGAQTPPIPSDSESTFAAPPVMSASVPLDVMGPHELDTSLDAIESTCRSLLRRRVIPGMSDPDHEYAKQLYMLIHRMYRQLERSLESANREVLELQMSERNFRALDVLGPTLALVGVHDRPGNMAEPASGSAKRTFPNTGSVALAVLELFNACSSAKEMCLGFQEQIERLCVAWRMRDDDAEHDASAEPVDMLASDPAMLVQAILGQLQRLADVLPAVKTRKPGATIKAVQSLIYPMLYRDVLCDALGMIHERDTHEDLATQATIALCELMLSLHMHATRMDVSERLDVRPMLVDALYALINFLPQVPDEVADASSRITVWNVVRKAYEQLNIDLGLYALGIPDVRRDGNAPLAFPHAQHAFVLLVRQLAYESLVARAQGRLRDRLHMTQPKSTRLVEPMRWTAESAREWLMRFAHVLPTKLVPELGPLDVSMSDRALASVSERSVCAAMVAFADWIERALPCDQPALPVVPTTASESTNARLRGLNDGLTYPVRALALIATTCSDASIRSRAFNVIVRLLRDHSADDTMVRLVRECMAPTSPAPLRGATVHLVRDIVTRRLDQIERGWTASDPLLQDGRLWRVWNDELFVVPPSAPQPPSGDDNADASLTHLAQYLTLHQTYLQECLSLLYFVAKRDAQHNVTGLHDEREFGRLYMRFVHPLAQWISAWQAYIQQTMPGDALDFQLSLIETAIVRIRDGLLQP